VSTHKEAVSSSVVTIVIVVAVVAAGLMMGKRYVDQELATRPRVVFVDEVRWVKESKSTDGLPRDRAEAAVARTRSVAKALADEGYLVLDRTAVYAAPAGVEVVP